MVIRVFYYRNKFNLVVIQVFKFDICLIYYFVCDYINLMGV